jgi:hypothetical protein
VASRYWMPSLTVLVLLFSAGWFTANMVGTQAGAAFVTTLTLKGKVVRVHGRPVKVLVPPHTVFHNGQKVFVPARTVDVTGPTTTQLATIPQTVTTTVPTTTVVTMPITVTQTITETSTSSSSTTTSGSTTTATSGVSTTIDSSP